MTRNDSPNTTRESLETKALPFVFEDMTDDRHRRAVLEVRAARAWVEQRRANGQQPN